MWDCKVDSWRAKKLVQDEAKQPAELGYRLDFWSYPGVSEMTCMYSVVKAWSSGVLHVGTLFGPLVLNGGGKEDARHINLDAPAHNRLLSRRCHCPSTHRHPITFSRRRASDSEPVYSSIFARFSLFTTPEREHSNLVLFLSSPRTPSLNTSTNMDTLVAKLAPAHRAPPTEEVEGYGNLDARGAVSGMQVPAVPDVRKDAELVQNIQANRLPAPRLPVAPH